MSRPKRGDPGWDPSTDVVWQLIGDPPGSTTGRYLGLAAEARLLREIGHPDPLLEAAAVLDGITSTGDPSIPQAAERLRALANLSALCLQTIKEVGLVFDPDTREVKIPRDGRGPREKLVTILTKAAWDELERTSKDPWLDAGTFEAVRARLADLLPADELTDARIKARLQRTINASG